MIVQEQELRNGFTTGTTATLAAMAAMHFLMTGVAPERIAVPLPPFSALSTGAAIPAVWLDLAPACAGHGAAPGLDIQGFSFIAHAGAIKDAGDDPDATDGLLIYATLCADRQDEQERESFLRICGGPGIGVVTAPGLPVPVGEAAINPVPRAQISYALAYLHEKFLNAGSLRFAPPYKLVLSAPEGEARAARTLNPRLGIRGGISILGTHGIVRPYSHAAFKKTVEQQIDFARKNGVHAVCLSTGRRSEKMLMREFPELPYAAFIQAGDLAEFAFSACGQGFGKLIWGCFFGKLLKLAQGLPNTHAHENAQNLDALIGLARQKGLSCANALATCLTGQAALEILLSESSGMSVIMGILHQAKSVAEGFAGAPVEIVLFNVDGKVLGKA